ncbi:hypothetical protein [Embleya sp. NPDC056538]|uniref:hypothetical protein n=1 Tax=Embleya sp. NPDC056538 TaxID=3345858 RepID=UPI00367AF4EA
MADDLREVASGDGDDEPVPEEGRFCVEVQDALDARRQSRNDGFADEPAVPAPAG